MVTFVIRLTSRPFFSVAPSIIETALPAIHYLSCTQGLAPHGIHAFTS